MVVKVRALGVIPQIHFVLNSVELSQDGIKLSETVTSPAGLQIRA